MGTSSPPPGSPSPPRRRRGLKGRTTARPDERVRWPGRQPPPSGCSPPTMPARRSGRYDRTSRCSRQRQNRRSRRSTASGKRPRRSNTSSRRTHPSLRTESRTWPSFTTGKGGSRQRLRAHDEGAASLPRQRPHVEGEPVRTACSPTHASQEALVRHPTRIACSVVTPLMVPATTSA